MGRSRKKILTKRLHVTYVTSSEFKREENRVYCQHAQIDGMPVKDLFDFEFSDVKVKEVLEVDLTVMVREEVIRAYSRVRVPCIVEHAGLVFDDYREKWYPGGLTKPMWNALGADFLLETNSRGRKAIAKAVVAYCDGMKTLIFAGETEGTLSDQPRGKRAFYWDTIFIPRDASGRAAGLTFAEICEDPSLGLRYKMTELSQSSRAMEQLLRYLRDQPRAEMWRT